MPSYELPGDLSAEEERAVLAALERALEATRQRPAAWAIAGRLESLRMGALQARRAVDRAWGYRGHVDFARRGTSRLVGRGDAR